MHGVCASENSGAGIHAAICMVCACAFENHLVYYIIYTVNLFRHVGYVSCVPPF